MGTGFNEGLIYPEDLPRVVLVVCDASNRVSSLYHDGIESVVQCGFLHEASNRSRPPVLLLHFLPPSPPEEYKHTHSKTDDRKDSDHSASCNRGLVGWLLGCSRLLLRIGRAGRGGAGTGAACALGVCGGEGQISIALRQTPHDLRRVWWYTPEAELVLDALDADEDSASSISGSSSRPVV